MSLFSSFPMRELISWPDILGAAARMEAVTVKTPTGLPLFKESNSYLTVVKKYNLDDYAIADVENVAVARLKHLVQMLRGYAAARFHLLNPKDSLKPHCQVSALTHIWTVQLFPKIRTLPQLFVANVAALISR